MQYLALNCKVIPSPHLYDYTFNMYINICIAHKNDVFSVLWGRAPGAVVKLSAWNVEDHGFEPVYDIQAAKEQKFLPCSIVKIEYCGEPL